MEREDLTGQTFGRLTVVEFDHSKDKKVIGNVSVFVAILLFQGQIY